MEWSIRKIRPFPIIALTLAILMLRKLWVAHNAMRIVTSCHQQVLTEKIISDETFLEVIRSMSCTEPTLVLIFNKYALNMTLNWLCNTENMKDVHERTLAVVLDRESYDTIALLWPKITRFYWYIPCLQRPFNYGEGYYQLLYLFRSNLARAFLNFNKPFWMIQQDTFWRKSIFEMPLSDAQKEVDLVFDKTSDSTSPLIAGGYYLVKPTFGSRAFFDQLSARLERHYVPDNTYMTALCAHLSSTRCESFNFQEIATWFWLVDLSEKASTVPYLLQFDGEAKLGGKLATLRQLGFYFLNDDKVTCNASAVSAAADSLTRGTIDTSAMRSYSRSQFEFYQILIDHVYEFSNTEVLLNRVVLPYAYYFMITI